MNNRGDIKREAKRFVFQGKRSPMIACLIIVLVSFLINILASALAAPPALSQQEALSLYLNSLQAGDVDSALAALQGMLPQPTAAGSFVRIAGQLLLTILSAGFTYFCMGIRQGREMGYGSLMEGLSRAGRVIWCAILMYIKVALWTMLFIVPGIIAAYRYRFAIYNILSDDRLSAGQAIRLSCIQTQGMKGDLFVLDLSFLGWSILSYLTSGILNVWLTPYMTFADLGYYDEAQLRLGRTISQGPGADGSSPSSGPDIPNGTDTTGGPDPWNR